MRCGKSLANFLFKVLARSPFVYIRPEALGCVKWALDDLYTNLMQACRPEESLLRCPVEAVASVLVKCYRRPACRQRLARALARPGPAGR